MYDTTITISLPVALAPIAAMIGRALDPDSGGEKSFVTSADVLAISTSAPCTAEFAQQAAYMLANPAALHAACATDYAARWGEMTPPTLAECVQFCDGAVIA